MDIAVIAHLILIMGVVLDEASTYLGFSLGLMELNPNVASLMERGLWFKAETGLRLTGYRAEIPVMVKLPRNAEPGSYSKPMTLRFTTASGDTVTARGIYHLTVVEGPGGGEEGGGNPLENLPEVIEPIVEPVKEILASKIAQMLGLLIIITISLAIISTRE